MKGFARYAVDLTMAVSTFGLGTAFYEKKLLRLLVVK